MQLERNLHANCSEWNNYGDDDEPEIDKLEAFANGEYKSMEQLAKELKEKEDKDDSKEHSVHSSGTGKTVRFTVPGHPGCCKG